MLIKINGKEEMVQLASTLEELLLGKKLMPERVVIEHNSTIVPRENLSKTALKENDTVEIVSFVGGG